MTHAIAMADNVAAVFMPAMFDAEKLDDGSMRVWFRGIDVTYLMTFSELVQIEELMNGVLKKQKESAPA